MSVFAATAKDAVNSGRNAATAIGLILHIPTGCAAESFTDAAAGGEIAAEARQKIENGAKPIGFAPPVCMRFSFG